MIRLLTAAFAAAMLLACAVSAHAHGRAGPPPPSIYTPGWRVGAPAIAARAAWGAGVATWRTGSDLVAEAARYVGSGKFTPFAGPWCADSVSAWLRATGRPPLASRMAAAALTYGPHVSNPSPGDLVVMKTRRGYAGHVGVVEGVNADGSIAIISGNWSRHVARGVISRGVVTAFVSVR